MVALIMLEMRTIKISLIFWFPLKRKTCLDLELIEFIKAIILDMFAAGSDTTSTALERAMTELLRRPEIMHKLKTEIRSIAGSKTFITEDDLEAMVYLKAVIKETVRLHPPLPFLVPRASRTKVEIDGYEIKQGYQVYINAWAIGRDPISWEIPEEFEPDRFLRSVVDYKAMISG
ncbi:cytochrome P450 71A8 [Ziziphus jujuba]|uniref:Cytochrome P450 71A8 n=1 Tax=Ziziphus jujuba TaxID=326968 RepID=A0ABM3IKZ1_ZIZJJ|nr:cytochrome P450 71A8 [Ziziphus jujuba]